jgi:hypothetical protein
MSTIVRIQKNQSWGTVTLETDTDLTGGTDPKILLESPDGVKSEWDGAVINDDDGNPTWIQVTLSDTFKAGWVGKGFVQAKITFGTLTAYGEAVPFDVGKILE